MTWGNYKSPEDDWEQEFGPMELECKQEFRGYLISDELFSVLSGLNLEAAKAASFAREHCYGEDIDCPFIGEVTVTVYGNGKEAGEAIFDCPVCGNENRLDPEDILGD